MSSSSGASSRIEPVTLPPHLNLLGVNISRTNYAEATHHIMESAKAGKPLGVSALAVHAIMEAHRDPELRARLRALDIATPDGQPVRWAINWLHQAALTDRVYGPFLMLHLCAAAERAGISIYLFGTTQTTLNLLRIELGKRFPQLIIAGSQSSRFREISREEADADAQTIIASGARLVFCGLGCPRQEIWVHAMRSRIPCPLVAVGAAFALWAGERPMAPSWMQRTGLEWLYRFAQEPSRLAYRYLVFNPWYICCVLRQKLFPHAYPLEANNASERYFG